MDSFLSVKLVDGLRRLHEGATRIVLESPSCLVRPPITLSGVTPGLAEALDRLTTGGVTETLLFTMMLGREGPPGVAALHGWLRQLDAFAAIERTLVVDGGPVATLRPLACAFDAKPALLASGQAHVLSRFACCRNDRGRLVLETPLGHAEVEIHDPRVTHAIKCLIRPSTVAGLAEQVQGLDFGAAAMLLDLLHHARIVVASPAGDVTPEDSDPALGRWAFHDLLFHSRHRLGRHADPYGGCYAFAGRFEAPPVLKPPVAGDVVPLDRPDLEALSRSDPPFSRVLEARASYRRPGDPPLTVDQLGDFLYRCARVKTLDVIHGYSLRPYPSGGALHALEIYPVVARCSGLAGGLYHYDPAEHVVRRMAASEELVEALIEDARASAALDQRPQVLLVISARFQRTQQKYQSVAYSLILKDTGCLMQTMYLVATAMGLAPCALGGGHSDLFAQAAGLDYYAETSVGEFILSSRGGDRD